MSPFSEKGDINYKKFKIMNRKTLFFLFIIICFFTGVTASYLLNKEVSTIDLRPTIVKGNKMPNFVVFDTNGIGTKLSNLMSDEEENILILFSLECTSCLKDAELWSKNYESFGGKYTFLGIAYDRTNSKLKNFIDRSNVEYQNVIIDKYTVSKLGIKKWPLIYILDKDRVVNFLIYGDKASYYLSEYLMKK